MKLDLHQQFWKILSLESKLPDALITRVYLEFLKSAIERVIQISQLSDDQMSELANASDRFIELCNEQGDTLDFSKQHQKYLSSVRSILGDKLQKHFDHESAVIYEQIAKSTNGLIDPTKKDSLDKIVRQLQTIS